MNEAHQLIDGKYELLDAVGQGGMATVWRGTMHGAAGFTRAVAIKKLRHRLDASNQHIRMFVEEARVGAELAHPNIVRVLDFCTDDAGDYYLIMEWVDGLDLAAFVSAYSRHDRRVPWQLVVAIGVGVLRGLAAAHERREAGGAPAPVIHRDISPNNILLASDGVAKLSDFGLARARDRGESLTGPGVVKGQMRYWAPEVANGAVATEASDIFAVGVVLWEALSAERLFDGETRIEVYNKVLACEVRPLATRRPDVPDRVVAAIYRALQAIPEARFHTARLMAQELSDILAEHGAVDNHEALRVAILEARERLGLAPQNS